MINFASPAVRGWSVAVLAHPGMGGWSLPPGVVTVAIATIRLLAAVFVFVFVFVAFDVHLGLREGCEEVSHPGLDRVIQAIHDQANCNVCPVAAPFLGRIIGFYLYAVLPELPCERAWRDRAA
jgi:hypothetical protein